MFQHCFLSMRTQGHMRKLPLLARAVVLRTQFSVVLQRPMPVAFLFNHTLTGDADTSLVSALRGDVRCLQLRHPRDFGGLRVVGPVLVRGYTFRVTFWLRLRRRARAGTRAGLILRWNIHYMHFTRASDPLYVLMENLRAGTRHPSTGSLRTKALQLGLTDHRAGPKYGRFPRASPVGSGKFDVCERTSVVGSWKTYGSVLDHTPGDAIRGSPSPSKL